jgi:hypothetical protein
MGLFNTLLTALPCPNCSDIIEKQIQFKYGDTRLNEYRIGDRLRWGSNNEGQPGYKKVKVWATGVHCPICGYDPEWDEYEILIENDILISVTSLLNWDEYLAERKTYIVINE